MISIFTSSGSLMGRFIVSFIFNIKYCVYLYFQIGAPDGSLTQECGIELRERRLMGSDFPSSPRVLKGGIVAYQLPSLLPTVIVFQYNPDEVSRSLQIQGANGGGRGDANRVNGPPQE